MKNKPIEFDLESRTLKFSEEVLMFCTKIKQTPVTSPMINQLVRSATSVGANYCEANNASSKKDFKNKIFICKKECQETKYWLKLFQKCCYEQTDKINLLWQECHELNLIFQKIISTMDKSKT